MPLMLTINGQPREFSNLEPQSTVADLVTTMNLKGDRIAVELNHEIAPRGLWGDLQLARGDRLEIVHFVGGGAGTTQWGPIVGIRSDCDGTCDWQQSGRG